MGIQQTKTLLKNYYSKPSNKDPDSYLQKAFNPEALQFTEFLYHFWDTTANEHFDWTNIQENKKFEDIAKEKDKFYLREKLILPELPDNKIIRENIFSIETLAENKEAFNPSDTTFFSESFIQRMNIILYAYVKKIISTLNETSSLDCMAKYFEKEEDKDAKITYDLGMNLFVKMLDDQTLTNKNKKLKEEALDFMLNSLVFIRPLNFYGETKQFFLLDKSLDQIVNYLKKIISDPEEEKLLRIKAQKILLNLALAKGSLKNLLDFVKYYDYLDSFIDLNKEINIFKNEFIKLSLSYPTSTNVIVKSQMWNLKTTQKKKKEGEENKPENHVSLTNDGSYIYLFTSSGILLKIGTGYKNTMLGNVYLIKENFKVGEKGTIAVIENVLYYRSPSLDPNPLLCIDPENFNEIPLNYIINSREPNHIWIESKKNDFEFPHNTFKDMNEIIEKKKNMGSEDKPNQRPTSSSPMTTDGRYIYIFSKWFDDYDSNIDKAADDDDDEPKNANKKPIVSIYGVDIYDPLNDMCNVKSIKLNLENKNKNNLEEVSLPDLLAANTIIYTNGNIIVIGKYKFSLITGEQIEKEIETTEVLKSACYDLVNNVIWGVSNKTDANLDKFDLICYFNHSAKPIVEYPTNHPKYMPCSLENIIQFAEQNIKLENLSEKISVKTYQREITLNILGLEDTESEKYKKQNLINSEHKNEDIIPYKKSVQCLILSTIAKLSEYYGQVPDIRSANTDEERGEIFSKACRRPYCVKLESETFENLIVFINKFSENFFQTIENSKDNTNIIKYLDSYCLLSTIKILRTNLSCLSLSNLDLKFFIKDNNNNNPFLKVKKFIFKILEIYNKKFLENQNNNQDITKLSENEKKNFEIIKALYDECKIILLVSVNTLYPEYNDIINILEREIINFKTSNYSRDVVNSILEWMSNEENMKNLLAKLKNTEINRIFEIFKTVSSWEVKSFSVYLKNFKDFTQMQKFSNLNNDEIIAFKFSSNMQIEILKSISKKLLNENYDEIENEQLLQSFSNIIFNDVLEIFKDLRIFMENIKNLVKDEYNSKHQNKLIDDEEVIDTSVKNTEAPENKTIPSEMTMEQYSKSKIKEIWNFIIDKIITNNLYIMKIFNFHIDSLSILTSNFVISSLMLNSFNEIMSEMNNIYIIIKDMEAESTTETEKNDYKEIIIESEHPYLANQTKWFTIDIPGEKELFLEFDAASLTKVNCAYVYLYTDRTSSVYAFPNVGMLNSTYPKETLTYANGPLELYFYSDSCANSGGLYGFKLKVHNGKKNGTIITNDKFSNLMRSVCWVSCKCSSQLLRGNFTKTVASGTDEEDIKYTNLLNSKLFAGGLEFEEIRKENDQNITNILEILEKIQPEEANIESPILVSEKNLLFNILNGDNENINKFIVILQKKFSEEIVWSHIGGLQADRLVRSAFAALLRHSGQTQDFKDILDIIEFYEENNEVKNNTEVQTIDKVLIPNNLTNMVIKHIKFPSIFKKWQASSRMRTWLVEKKKNVDEALEKTKPTNNNTKKEENGNSTNNPNGNIENKIQIQNQLEKEKEENNSDEIMNKIIEQTVIKAKFLIKLNPSPAFVEDNEDKKTQSNILIRSSSIDLNKNNDDSWKTRLNQWKILQKSKKVIRSVEDEANEKFSSLTSSVLLTLQSTISSKRLFNKIKIATIRAKSREIGLITLRNIFNQINHSSLVKDLLSWFCASLRKPDNKICHYLDNLSGCGSEFETRIEDSFHEFIILLIQKLISIESPFELKSFVDALMWRYSSIDHKFLVEQSIFLILWGSYNTCLKSAWGKPLKSTIELPVNKDITPINSEFTKDILELFEILSNICIEKATMSTYDRQKLADKINKGPINIKFPNLERTISCIDDNSSENLINHILDVIFGEASNAISSYLKNRGISYRLWQQYEQYVEDKLDDKKKKKTGPGIREENSGNRHRRGRGGHRNRNRSHSDDDLSDNGSEEIEDEESERRDEDADQEVAARNNENNAKEKDEDKNDENDDKPYLYDNSDKINLYDELRLEESKSNKFYNKIMCSPNDLLNLVYTQNETIYDPEFLHRILLVLYKCSIQYQNEKILFNVANPHSFCTLFKLIRICSTPEKILITKILNNIACHIPEEILIEGIDLFIKDSENDIFVNKFVQKRKNYNTYDKKVFIEFIIELIIDLRSKCWSKENESTGAYIVTSHLIELLRNLWQIENWKDSINNLFKDLTDIFENISENSEILNNLNEKLLRKEIIVGIFGGDYFGMVTGAVVKVKNEINQNSVDFDFIKKDFVDHYNIGTILGFSNNMEEIWQKKSTKENKNKKNQKSNCIHLTPNNYPENQISLLLNDSILKDEFNLIDISPKIYNQHEVVISQKQINFDNLNISSEDLEKILLFVIKSKNELSSVLNLKTNYLRFLEKFLKTEKGISLLKNIKDDILQEVLIELSKISTNKILHNNYLSLELLEEKRFRVINFCLENKSSLNELDIISVAFRKPNHLLLRINKDNLINMTYQICGTSNYDLLNRLSEFMSLGIDKELELKISGSQQKYIKLVKDDFEVILTDFENIENYLTENKKTLIITTHTDNKFIETKYKKYDNTAIILLEPNSFNEITNLYCDVILKKEKLDNIQILKRIYFDSNVNPNETHKNEVENKIINETIRELQDFGFEEELIKTEINKMKDSFNINNLINNLIEYKEKRKENAFKSEDEHSIENIELNIEGNNENEPVEKLEKIKIEDEKKSDDIDDEVKNDCFNTKEEDKKSTIPEFFDEMLIPDKVDNCLIYQLFKSINEKICVLYSRRILLNILYKTLDNIKEENKESNQKILSYIPEDSILKNLKLLTNEGLFINSVNYGSDLLLQIKDLLIKLFSNNTNIIAVNIADKLMKNTFADLEKILEGKLEVYEFVLNNEESILNKPVLFFSIWNLMIMNEFSNKKPEYSYMFNILGGVVTKIKDNKQIRWFLLDLLIQLTNKILNSLKDDYELLINMAEDKMFKNIQNINKLRIFLDESVGKESKKNLSKRSQMICELLIYLEELELKINQLSGKKDKNSVSNLLESNIKQDNFIFDLLTTFEMMKEFFEKKYLKYLAWTEMNPDIVNSSKLTFESSHLYPKAPHTFLINVPNSISMDITIHSDTLLDNGDAMVFSLDKNRNYPIECYANRNSKKTFSIQSSHIFVHFPSNYLNEIYSFGSNGSNRLGHPGSDIYNPKLIDSLSSYVIKDICIGDTFVMVLTTNGELFSCGSGLASGLKQSTNTFTKAVNINSQEKINSTGISSMCVFQSATIISTKDFNFYSVGLNTNGQLGQGWTSPVNDITNMNFVKKIKQISISETHTMMVSYEGTVYHLGNNDYYQSGEYNTTRNNTPKALDLGKELVCEMVSTGEFFTLFIMKHILTQKSKLYSSGFCKNGRNGIGKDDDTYQVFKPIPCLENENVEFKIVCSSKTCSGAITTTGKLYTWGLNTRGNLAFGHFNNINEPTLVTYFDKMEVLDISMSVDHTIILAKDIEKNKISVYGCGDYSNGKLGETITQKTEKKDCISTPIKISFFEGKNPYKIYTGPRATIIMCKIKPYEEIRDTHNIECSLCSKNPVIGNLYVDLFTEGGNETEDLNFIKDSEIKFYCQFCIKVSEMSNKLPKLLIKSPLRDYSFIKELLKKQNFIPKIDTEKSKKIGDETESCKNCKEALNYENGVYQYLDNKIINSLCSNCIDLYPSCITSVKVYLKGFCKLKNIEITNTTNFYDNSISYGHKFSILPVLNEKGSEIIIEKNLNSFNNFVDEINEFNKFEVYEQLVDLLNNTSQKAEKSIFTYSPKDLSFKKEELSLRGSLEKSSPEVLRKMFVILKILNTRVKDLLPFIDFSKVLQDNQRLSFHFNKITPLIFWDTKNEIIKFYLEKTYSDYECSEIKLNRMKTRRFIDKGKPDHTGEFTVFGQIYQYIKTKSFKIFKKKEGGNNAKMFNVTFVGEASIDAGGPYREALTQACAELQSSALPLFIPSPNQKNESGLFREKWIINPSAKSTTHLEMFKYFGGLIGYAMRTGEFLNLDLPSIFWKQLLEAPVDRKDLELIDRYTIQCLDDIYNIHKKGVTAQNFSFIVDQKFTTCLSDGSEVELINEGRNMEVNFGNRNKYCDLVEKIRLEESKIQIAAIRSGLE